MNNLYFDIAATTPLDEKVAKLINEVQTNVFGNPSSIHQFGQQAHNILERSRKNISKLLSCQESEIYFTSGGTESITENSNKGIAKRGRIADNYGDIGSGAIRLPLWLGQPSDAYSGRSHASRSVMAGVC